MQYIHIDTPVWQNTLPCRVIPFPDEWLSGLLLRCDERNHWSSGTTSAYLLRDSTRNTSQLPHFLIPPAFLLEDLADIIAVPIQSLFATTYLSEMTRIYNLSRMPHSMLLNSSFSFRLCPDCARHRLLKRTLMLPNLSICPLHSGLLCQKCPCGTVQRLFCRQARPFSCSRCGLDWAAFPRITGSPEDISRGSRILAWYDLFFSQGTPELLTNTSKLLHHAFSRKSSSVLLLDGKMRSALPNFRAHPSLGHVVDWLVSLDLSPQDLTSE